MNGDAEDELAEWEITHEEFDARWAEAEPAELHRGAAPAGIALTSGNLFVLELSANRIADGIPVRAVRSGQIPA